MPLGRSIVVDDEPDAEDEVSFEEANTRHSLWETRWPAIALQECIDKVDEAPLKDRAQVKQELPCKLCPENVRCLNAKRKELGPLLYGRELLTRARSQEASLFPRKLMAPMLDRSRGCLPHYLKPYGLESELVVASGWDVAWSEKVGGDFLVKITGEMNLRTGRKRVLDIRRWEAKTFPEQTALMVQQHALYHDDAVAIESDAAQVVWSQTVEATSNVPVLRHAAGTEKKSLHIGVPALLIDFALRRWSFPYRTSGLRVNEIENMLIELAAFGHNPDTGQLEGLGEHDDTVMALWHLWYALQCLSGGIRDWHAGITAGRAT
jgi:hypothetical protein